MNKEKILVICVIGIVVAMSLYLLFQVSYMARVESAFGDIREEAKDSYVLEKELGEIQDVKFDNYMQWISQDQGEDCVKMVVVTEDNRYPICTMVEKNNQKYYSTGYIIGNHIIYQETTKSSD
jgi:hypothetical protein